MLSSVCRYALKVATSIVAAGFIFASSAVAQSNQNQAIDQFLANPNQVLQQYPKGGAQLISLIRDVCVSHKEALKTLTGLLKGSNKEQQLATGSGLGQCAQIAVRTDQAYANQIQQAVADSGSEDANTAFAGVTGNVTIASSGPGGGGGGGVGGPTGTSGFAFGGVNSGNAQAFGGQHFQTSSQLFTGGGAGVSGTTSSGSVSPH